MKTFMEWLESAQWGNKIKLHGYNHYMCDKCGQTLDDTWIKDFGMNCMCGGKLAVVDPDSIDKNDMLYYQTQAKKPLRLRGSGK